MVLDQSSFPDSWARDCPDKRTKVEVGVPPEELQPSDIEDANFDAVVNALNGVATWVEIPTSHVETWEKKGDNVTIKRTSKVQAPAEWDGASVRQVLGGRGNSTLRYGRVWHKAPNDQWVLKHCGYIWGVGRGSNELEVKAWIYDFSELLKAVPVDRSYNDPTLGEIASDLFALIGNQSTIPITGATVIKPDTEEELSIFWQDFWRRYADNDVPDAVRSARTYYSVGDNEGLQVLDAEDIDLVDLTLDTGISAQDIPYFADFGSGRLGEWFGNTFGIGIKKFRPNRHTAFDILNWVASRTDVQWHFEPTQNGTMLLFDIVPSRRQFAQTALLDDLDGASDDTQDRLLSNLIGQGETYDVHGAVEVETNDALYEINPYNEQKVVGEKARSLDGDTLSVEGIGELVKPMAESGYPVVKARADPLYEAAAETSMPAKRIENDAETVDQAKVDAATALRTRIREQTEGDISCLGNPRIRPYDTLDAYETCDDFVQEQVPIRYEVQGVKHEESMTDLYRMTVDVVVHVPDAAISFPIATVK